MSKPISNVDIITDSWENSILLLNSIVYSLQTEIITANTTYANTGNTSVSRTAQLWGSFGSNTIVVANSLRGGNVNGLFANLVINTNTNVSNTSAANINYQVSNSSTFSYMNPVGGYFGNTSSNSVVNTSTITIQTSATVNVTSNSTIIRVANSTSSANITSSQFQTGIFKANTTTITLGANVSVNSSSINIAGTADSTLISNSVVRTGNISSLYTQSTNSEYRVIGSSSNAIINSNSISVGNSALTNTNITLADHYKIDLLVNTNIGATTGSPIKVYSYPKTDWSSGKFEVQIKNTGNTQISELILAHDGTSAYVSIYGTVASPANANTSVSPLGTFSANVNNANVDLLITQTIASSAVKVVAHLIK